MARTLSADLFTPQVATEYAFSAFTENLALLQLALTGAQGSPIQVVPPDKLSEEGARLVMPFFQRMSNLITRQNLATITAPTPLKLVGSTRDMVIMRGKVGPIEISQASLRTSRATDAQINAEIGKQAGEEMNKYVQDRIFDIILASLGITIGGVSHVFDAYEPYAPVASTAAVVANTLSMGLINAGKTLLADYQDRLTTMLLRSEVAQDLVDLNLATGYDSIAGYTALTGRVRTLGLGDPLVMDNAGMVSANPSGSRTGSGSGTGDASDNLFRTLLLGPAMGMLTFPHNLDFTVQGPLADGESAYLRILGEFDFGFMVRGIGWKSGSDDNPTAAQVADSGNYEDKTSGGHKEVLAAVIESNRKSDV